MGRRAGVFFFVLIVIALSAGCGSAHPPREDTAIASGISPSRTPDPTGTPTAAPTVTPTDAPVPFQTLAPPVYPHITLPGTDRLRELFREGQRRGLRSAVFSKVGDSITANNVFLVPFGTGDYSLGEYGCLQDVIDFFSRENAREGNSFLNDSLAARTSWRAEHVLDPARNRPPCETVESPLLCEYRIVQPAIAVIMLGTNDVMSDTGSFRESYRKILVNTLTRGIIPILNTVPPMVGRDVGPYNAVIRDLAERWDVPWIDLYAVLAPLPHQGLTPDGIHLSWVEPAVFQPQYLRQGMTSRNLVTLQALDAVWRSYPSPSLPSPICFTANERAK